MAIVSLRMADELKSVLERMAVEKDTTVSALINAQIVELAGSVDEVRPDSPYSLAPSDRYALMRMNEMMAVLHPEDQGSYEEDAEAFRQGYVAEYSRIFSQMREELSRRDCEMVWDLLDMLRVLGVSYEALTESDRVGIDEPSCHYQGFDRNDALEGSMASYVDYLAGTGRWTWTADDSLRYSDKGDAHMPMLPVYRRMFDAYERVKLDRSVSEPNYYAIGWRLLTREEIIVVVNGTEPHRE